MKTDKTERNDVMTRLIDANELTAQIMCMITDKAVVYGNNAIKGSKEIFALAMVTQAPTIDAEPVRHGKWIRQTDTRFGEMLNDILICSECNVAFSTVNMIRRSYCPNCGCRMDKE